MQIILVLLLGDFDEIYRCFLLTCSCNGLSPDAAAAAIVDGMNCMG